MKAERVQAGGNSTQRLKARGSDRTPAFGRILAANCWRAKASVRMKRKMASAVPSSIQRVASATVSGYAMILAARIAAAKGQACFASGATT